MKKKLRSLVFVLFILMGSFIYNPVKSDPFFGENITWSCIGQDSFLVTVTVYSDCNSISLWNLTVTAKCASNNTTINSVACPAPIGLDITPVCKTSCNRCISVPCTYPYGIKKYVYYYLFNLASAGSCCEVLFCNSEWWRQSSITTGPSGQDFYLEAKLNRCLSPCDNSPAFINDPLVILCKDRDYFISNFAIDSDKDSNGSLLDSLSYELVPPKINATTSVSFIGQYTYDKPIYFWGFPNKNLSLPSGFHFNSSTGDLAFRPVKIEHTIMAIKVKEWRKINGVMTNIGEITRDETYMVINCPAGFNPTLSVASVKHVCAGDSLFLPVTSADHDANDSLLISVYNLPPGAVWTDNNGLVKKPAGSLGWRTKGSNIRSSPYNLMIKVRDDGCPLIGQASQVVSIYIHSRPEGEIKIEKQTCNQFRLSAEKIKEVVSLKWYVNNAYVSNTVQYNYDVDSSGRIPIRLELTGYGCTEYVYDTLDIPYFIKVKLPSDTILCRGDSLTINPQISDAQGNVSYLWSTGDTTPTLQIGPLYQDTIITLYAEDSMFCHSDTMLIKVDQFDVAITQDKVVCPGFPAILLASPLFDEGQQVKTYFWKDLSCGCPKGYDDSLTIYQSGVFTCLLENANGCRATDTISAIYHKTPLLSLYAIPDKCLNEADFPLDSFADPKGGVWRAQDTIVVLNNAFLLSKAVVKPYMLFYDYTDSTTTCSNSASITFTVKKVPDIVLLSPLSYCDEDRLIDLSAHVSPQNGYWDTLHPAIVNAHYFNPHLTALVSNPLSYQVDSTNGCSNLLLIEYIINPMPEADFTADSLQGQSPLTVQFTNLSVISAGNMHYLWYFGDGDSSVLEDPSHVFLNTGQYDVRLIAVSDSLCRAERTKSKFIEVFASLPDLLTGAVSVYPNPAEDQLIIESSSKLDKVILYNFLGAKIREMDVNENKVTFNRDKLPSGLYLLKVYDIKGDVYVFQVVFK